jgi:hypothetical protein
LWNTASARREGARLVLRMAQIVEPNVEEFSLALSQVPILTVWLKGASERVPIGNLGEGFGRMVALGCLLTAAKGVEGSNGIVLVDEIDTGLHVGVIEEMWKLIFEVAQKLDVQVFATTHSEDCLRGLAYVLEREEKFRDDVVLHKLVRGRKTTIANDADGIIKTQDAGIEVR